MSKSIKVGITQGDINSISYEVILKALSDNRIFENKSIIIYGSAKIAAFHKKNLGGNQLNLNQIQDASQALDRKANIITVCDQNLRVDLGKSMPEAGQAAYQALEAACADLKAGKIDVLVTAPINKNNIYSDDFKFPGHTEYLAKQFEVDENLMLLISGDLRVGVATGHIPIADVSKTITEELLLRKLSIMHQALITDLKFMKPKIAVLGLNPHAGDEGVIGSEEQTVIAPAVKKANEQGMVVSGPFAADGFFGSSDYTKYDAVLAMYHDQGLAPFKALAFDGSVNYTAGMPFVRTSPGHGTAYSLAGKNTASEAAMRNAIYLACDMFKNRGFYNEITSNPVKKADISDNFGAPQYQDRRQYRERRSETKEE